MAKINKPLKKASLVSTVVIPAQNRQWFFDKNGNVAYVCTNASTRIGKMKRRKAKTVTGSLQNIGFDMSKSSKKARDLNRR